MSATRIIMSASSALLLVMGAACLFMPIESLSAAGVQVSHEIVGQLLAALYLAFAMANWTARGSMIGGIYARPVALGNFAHFFIGSTSIVSSWPDGSVTPVFLGIVAAYVLSAIAFALILFGFFQRDL